MKIIKNTICFYLLWICFSLGLPSQSISYIEEDNIKISFETVNLFDKPPFSNPIVVEGTTIRNEQERAEKKIKIAFQKSFNDAISVYGNGSSITDATIRNAMNVLVNAIKNKTRFITIKFAFDKKGILEGAGYYNWYISKYSIKNNEGWTIGYNMKFADMIKNQDVHGWREPNSDVIQIFNGIEDFSYKGIEATDPNSDCKHESITYHLYSDAKPIIEGWNWTIDKNYKMASAIFHEMVHIAL